MDMTIFHAVASDILFGPQFVWQMTMVIRVEKSGGFAKSVTSQSQKVGIDGFF